MQSWLTELLEMSGAGNQGRDQGPEFGHQAFPFAPESMSVEPECWRVLGEQATGPALKWCLNRAVVSVKKELRHLKICSLGQLQKSPCAGLQ